MFLDVGDKVRKCRKLYGIRQNDFKPFGVSQHYLSMIEGHKRQPTLEMIDRIYDAFYELTDGKIKKVYSKETFKETPDEQVYQYLLKKSREGNIEKHYEQSIVLAKQHHLSDIVYELNFQMGTYERKRLNYDASTEYFIDAIQGGNHDNELLFRCYREIAFNMKQTQSYKSGVLYYKLTLKYMNPIHTILRYRFLYNLAHMYIGLDDYEQAISQLDEIIEHCESVETKAGSILLKCHAYLNQAKYHRAIKLLNDYVENKLYDPYELEPMSRTLKKT
ncbi:MAG: hypothetical protein K2G70_02095 [Turicibacter sp.]|nr:hypothetical protein [Turicibacter sp.]